MQKQGVNYDRQAKHKPVDRYEPPKITKKTNKAAAVAKVNERQYVAALQEIPIKSLTTNENPLKSWKGLINCLQLSNITGKASDKTQLGKFRLKCTPQPIC